MPCSSSLLTMGMGQITVTQAEAVSGQGRGHWGWANSKKAIWFHGTSVSSLEVPSYRQLRVHLLYVLRYHKIIQASLGASVVPSLTDGLSYSPNPFPLFVSILFLNYFLETAPVRDLSSFHDDGIMIVETSPEIISQVG
jgi:hypothetical protein